MHIIFELVLNFILPHHWMNNASFCVCQLGEHEKALSMLVHQLKDFGAAEQYCITQSRAAAHSKVKSNIFLKLLKIYLRPPPG